MNKQEIIYFDEYTTIISEAEDRASLYSDNAFSQQLKETILKSSKNSKVLSLDVFDTLLLRDDSAEITRFYEIAGRMSKVAQRLKNTQTVGQIDALVARHLGVKVSYRASDRVRGAREGSLIEIHNVSSELICGTDHLAAPFIDAELKYEVDRLSLNEILFDVMKQYRLDGRKVVLVSDMYMHAPHIELLLSRHGIQRENFDLLVSSADTKVSKSSGGIFEIIENSIGYAGEDIFHIGDSYKGDFRKPREHGWQATLLPVPKQNIAKRIADHRRTEHKLASQYGLTLDIAQPS